MIYIMNTGTKVHPTDPDRNDFGHSLDDSTFLVLELAHSPRRGRKIVSTAGPGAGLGVGDVTPVTQDTGWGHRSMRSHRVTAIIRKGDLVGYIPSRALPYWVFK
jgi:hypothetical protein